VKDFIVVLAVRDVPTLPIAFLVRLKIGLVGDWFNCCAYIEEHALIISAH
jgi:hypothetical protein